MPALSSAALRKTEFQKILLIKLSALGDVVHGIPVVSKLRRRFPSAQTRLAGAAGVCRARRASPRREQRAGASAPALEPAMAAAPRAGGARARRKISIPHNALAYRLRNRIERFFNKLKHFRHIATRYDGRAVYFLACLHLASAVIWMR